ncbi:MAG: hypothetical protein GY786_23720 [Proteobacteria bacterium]|nr:hypothetical protein [Pseudomonadota bacterium]
MKKNHTVLFSFLLLTVMMAGCESEKQISYISDIQPILKKYCVDCHLAEGSGTIQSGFLLDSYDNLMKGTKFGSVIMPGHSSSSTLYRLIAGKVDKSIQMPHSQNRMNVEEIVLIEKWIDQGALNN